VHIPLRNATSFNRETVRNLLKEFDNVHIMAGHTHYAQNYIDGDVYEHIHGAVCGAWWKSTINVDGTPNGYGVYDISGSKIENWYYKPTRLSKDFQIRMYRGETTFAAATSSPTRPPTRSWPISGTRTTGTGRSKCMKTATKPAR